MKISGEVFRIIFGAIQNYNANEISNIGDIHIETNNSYQMFNFICYEHELDDNDILQYIEDISKISKIIHILTSFKLEPPIKPRYFSEYTDDEKVRLKTCQQELYNLFVEGNARNIKQYVSDLISEFPPYFD